MSEAIVKVETQLPAVVDYSKYAGAGTEQASAGDYALPFLAILQKLSPQVDEADLRYIEGAKAGMILETATNQLFNGKDGIMVIPCHFKKDMIEWQPREAGGGFIKSHGWNETLMNQCTKDDRGRMILPNGHLLVDTKYEYVMVLDPQHPVQAVISMTSTQLKKSRKWLSMIAMRTLVGSNGKVFQAPSFAFTYKLTTGQESNEKGSWYGWQIEMGPLQEDPDVARSAIRFHQACIKGDVKLSDPDAGLKDDSIPF